MKNLAKAVLTLALASFSIFTTPSKSQTIDSSYFNNDSYFYEGRSYEDKFWAHKDTSDALNAIDSFGKYSDCTPDGTYICSALIRKALLLHSIGRDSISQIELNKAKESSKSNGIYSTVIEYIEKLIKNSGNKKETSQ